MATLLIMALKDESKMLFEKNQSTPFYCGIGQVKAAFMTQKLILEHRPSRILNMGTAGSFVLPQGSLVECTSFVQRFPASSISAPSTIIKADPISDLKQVICGTGDHVETGPDINKCDVMDMEAYAIAYVCQQMNVPFNSIKFVADSSDKNVLRDWKSNLGKSAAALFEHFNKISGLK